KFLCVFNIYFFRLSISFPINLFQDTYMIFAQYQCFNITLYSSYTIYASMYIQKNIFLYFLKQTKFKNEIYRYEFILFDGINILYYYFSFLSQDIFQGYTKIFLLKYSLYFPNVPKLFKIPSAIRTDFRQVL
ncbi:hypothetical protein IMG5_031490, partial [Ichthyophthirius multifiliis]